MEINLLPNMALETIRTTIAMPAEARIWTPKREHINGGIDAYAPINKVPTRTLSGTTVGYAVEIEDFESPTGWSLVAPHVSENYLLVENQEVRTIAHEIADASGWQFEENEMSFDGKNYVLTLDVVDPEVRQRIDDFRQGGGHRIIPREVRDDFMTFGLMFRNSYDAKQAFDFVLYMKRLVCSNGAVSVKHFARHRFTHTLKHADWREEVSRAASVIRTGPSHLKKFLAAAGLLAEREVNQDFLSEFRSGPGKKLGVTQWGAIMDRWVTKEEPTAYGILNAATNVLWHGKLNASDLKANEAVVTGLLDYAITYKN